MGKLGTEPNRLLLILDRGERGGSVSCFASHYEQCGSQSNCQQYKFARCSLLEHSCSSGFATRICCTILVSAHPPSLHSVRFERDERSYRPFIEISFNEVLFWFNRRRYQTMALPSGQDYSPAKQPSVTAVTPIILHTHSS